MQVSLCIPASIISGVHYMRTYCAYRLTALLLSLRSSCQPNSLHCPPPPTHPLYVGLGSSPHGRYPLGMNISFACPHVSTREPPKGTFNSTVSTSIPDPVFTWILKPLHSGGLGQPIREVLESNLWYSDPTHRVMYTVLLTREHLGTYTCECSRNCPTGKSSQHTFTVSEIEGEHLQFGVYSIASLNPWYPELSMCCISWYSWITFHPNCLDRNSWSSDNCVYVLKWCTQCGATFDFLLHMNMASP